MLSWLHSEPLATGTAAPDFTLMDQDGKSITLSLLRGKNVVLIFYPRDGTPTCRAQLCEFRDRSELRASTDTLVFGINPQDASSHTNFLTRQRLDFPLLVDKGASVCKAYNTKGLYTKRTVYLIGRDGTIRYAQRGKPSPGDVLAAADA